jgi:hypothetical protein
VLLGYSKRFSFRLNDQTTTHTLLNRQRIVTGGETVDDTYLGHVTIPSHLIIASRQCLWAIDKDSRDPWCISWTEISHFSVEGGNSLTITVFSSQGPHSYVFNMSSVELEEVCALLSMQTQKMVCSCL